MIYFVSPDIYPKEGQYSEQHKYEDENGFDWLVARVENGFFVKYEGDKYFTPSIFTVEVRVNNWSHLSHLQRTVKNTMCIFIQSKDFDTFYHVRNVIKSGYTDEIWDSFKMMLEKRMRHNSALISSEIS